MALFDKVTKALDALKLTLRIENVSKKKDVSIQFNYLADSICSPSLNEHKQIADLVGPAVETFLRFCDDPDSDIRMLADECLTRVIKASMLNYSGKVQVELCKHIKRNGPTKSLRIALTRFADLCHLIRPQKCRAYWLNMLSCMIAMSQRTEEMLWETLTVFVQKTFPILGLFAFDNEIKNLLRAWLPNLSSTSPTIRRCNAVCMATAANYGRKPQLSVALLVEHLTEQLASAEPTLPMPLIMGSLQCLRHVLPHISVISDDNNGVPLGRLLQMYELCIHFSTHADHNVVTSSLELLLHLLKLPLPLWQESLLSPQGLCGKRIGSELPDSKPQLSSKLSSQWTLVSTHSEDNMLLLEADMPIVPKVSMGAKSEENEEEIHHDLPELEDFMMKREETHNISPRQSTLEETFIVEVEKEEAGTEDEGRVAYHVGSLYDPEMSLLYTSRHLVAYFLLENDGGLVSDRFVRVALKSLALQGLLAVAQLHPDVWRLSLKPGETQSGPFVNQILDYAAHSDPQLRGHVILCASHMLAKSASPDQRGRLESLISDGLKDGAAFVARSAIQGLGCCLGTCLENGRPKIIFQNFHEVAQNPYWLVRVEYLEVLKSLLWPDIRFSEHSGFYSISLKNVEGLLGDEDPRVRQAACECLAQLALRGSQAPVVEKTQILMNVKKETTVLHPGVRNLAQPFTHLYSVESPVVSDLFKIMRTSASKHLLIGCVQALTHLAPLGFKLGSVNELKLILNLMTNSPLTHDLTAHQFLLQTTVYFLANFASSTETGVKVPPDVRSLVEPLTQHTIHVLYIVHWVVENYPPVTSLPTLASRVLLPLSPNRRKLSKAASEKEEEKKVKVVLQPHYMKLFEIAKRTYGSSKLLVEAAQDKFAAWVESILELLAAVLELVGLEDVGKLAEDLLLCLKSCVVSQPILSVSCTEQLLKSLFGANLAACKTPCSLSPSSTLIRSESVYSILFEQVKASNELLKPKLPRSSSLVSDRTVMSSYIRMFEPMVIKSLKLYTMNSSTCLQKQVLELVSQLIQLHVNYCLLDADLTFFRFVLQQFEFLDEGFIPKVETLLPSVFTFLILLSYEKYHSKTIINVPRIIQLCGSLLATGKDPIQYVIPALGPIVKDVFGRTSYLEDKSELETQREVLVSTMLRLIIHPQVFPWLGVALQEYQTEGGAWLRLSQDLVTVLIPALVRGQVLLTGAKDTQILLDLIDSVAHTWDVESLVQGVLAPPSTLVVDKANLEVWRTWLLNRSVLVYFLGPKLTAEVGKKVCNVPYFSLWSSDSKLGPSDPLNASESPVMVQNALLSVWLELITLSLECLQLAQDANDALAHVVFLLMSALSSGYKGFLIVAWESENSKIDTISKLAIDLAAFQPLIAVYWSRVILAMGGDCWEFFGKVRHLGVSLMNAYIAQCGVFAVICSTKDLKEEFLHRLMDHAEFTLGFIDEGPVQQCVDFLHKQPVSSVRLLQTFAQLSSTKREDLRKLWLATRNCHPGPECLSKLLSIAIENIFPRYFFDLGSQVHANLCCAISALSAPFLPPETLKATLTSLEIYSPLYDELAQLLHSLHKSCRNLNLAPVDLQLFHDWLESSFAYPTESTIGCTIWREAIRGQEDPGWRGLTVSCREGAVDSLLQRWRDCMHESIGDLNLREVAGLAYSLDVTLAANHSVAKLMGVDLQGIAALCLQLAGLVVSENVKYACRFLSCAERAFKQTQLLDEQNCGKALEGLSRVLTFFGPMTKTSSPTVDKSVLGELLKSEGEIMDIVPYSVCQGVPYFCQEMGRVWSWAWLDNAEQADCPDELVRHVRSVVVSLGKQPRFNSYLRMPPSMFTAEIAGRSTTDGAVLFPSVHVNQLLKKPALQEFISRTVRLGWTSRQQFEETWMTLLGVLFAATEESTEKIENDLELSCLVVKALTDLLLRAGRQKEIAPSSQFFETRWGGKLKQVLEILPREGEEIYYCSNLSERQRRLDDTGLDLESCIHLLIDLYTQWVVPQPLIAYPLLLEALKSVVALSELFTSSAHYAWLHDTLMALPYSVPPEDPSLSIPVLIEGLCKSATFCDAETITLDRLQEICHVFSYPAVHVAFIAHVGYLGKPGWEHLRLLRNSPTSSTEFQRNLLPEMQIAIPATRTAEMLPLVLELLPCLASKAFLVRQLEDWVLAGTLGVHARTQLHKIVGRLLRCCPGRDLKPLLRLTLILTYVDMNPAEETDVEAIFRTLEWLGALLDRCREPHTETLQSLEKLLPYLFRHYLPAVDVMNRILGQFVNATDDYAARISALLPPLFDAACEQGQKSMVLEWIFQSLDNFLQRLPVAEATWSLAVFFLAASSTDSLLRPLFPWWQERRGKFDEEDQQIFIWAALEFVHQLDPVSRESFLKLFHSLPYPFYQVIGSLPV